MHAVDEPMRETTLAPLTKKDWIVAMLLAAATAVFVFGHVHFPINPMEDASMLLRYAQNLAGGHGIVWNVGEHPVEGATDFLFMVLIAGISWLTKVDVQTAAAGILFVSHVVSVAVLYLGLRRLYRVPLLLAVGFAAVLGAGVGYHYIDKGFSAPFYALFALLTWYMASACILDGVTWKRAIWFSSLAFVTGLIRPDGVILVGLMLCAALYGVSAKRLPLVVSFGTIFAVLGGIYFAWRLHYFGYLLPNPVYIKRNTYGFIPILKITGRLFIDLLLPLLPLAGLAIRSRSSVRHLVSWLIVVAPFTAIWVIIIQDNNHYSRFQYVMVPLSLLSLGGLLTMWWQELVKDHPAAAASVRNSLACVMILLFSSTIFYNMHLFDVPFSNVGGQQLAERLRPYASRNYTMVTTEAGDIPFYSQWRAVDAIGLNDAYIAHHGGLITEQYLEQIHPEIILYDEWNAKFTPAMMQALDTGSPLNSNLKLFVGDMTMSNYAREYGYVLAAKWAGSDCDQVHVFWVRPDFPYRDAIVSAIRDHPYYMQTTGVLSYDFRNVPNPTVPCTVAGD
jgi:hypothetical protein